MHIEADHIQALIQQGAVRWLDQTVSTAANQFLGQTFPFPTQNSTRIIDWNAEPHTKLEWMEATNDETSAWAASTLAGSCATGLLLYSPTEPCLIGSFDFMIRNLDSLVWKAPGQRLLFGVELRSSDEVHFTRGIVEFDGRSTLFATV